MSEDALDMLSSIMKMAWRVSSASQSGSLIRDATAESLIRDIRLHCDYAERLLPGTIYDGYGLKEEVSDE